MAVQAVVIGLLFSQIFEQPLDEFLLYISGGLLVWVLLAVMITESCTILIDADAHLCALRIPSTVLPERIVSEKPSHPFPQPDRDRRVDGVLGRARHRGPDCRRGRFGRFVRGQHWHQPPPHPILALNACWGLLFDAAHPL